MLAEVGIFYPSKTCVPILLFFDRSVFVLSNPDINRSYILNGLESSLSSVLFDELCESNSSYKIGRSLSNGDYSLEFFEVSFCSNPSVTG